jgi:hypothetical protein
MSIDEKDFLHVRLNKARTKKIRRIVKQTGRKLNLEVGLAIDQYKPKHVIFKDDGK